LSPQQLLIEAPEVRYVMATMDGLYEEAPDNTVRRASLEQLGKINPRLSIELLLTQESGLPSRYKLIGEVVADEQTRLPVGRLFEILPP
jgi:hypothetical protein